MELIAVRCKQVAVTVSKLRRLKNFNRNIC